ncbi:PhzF family phenazine biosynthesis protein [Neorhizobium sp. NPDC001467]|uniref:PhzF family phenazine biosynthesis protein n=1 Tax=Neorhizobium sp. NPDC001467 TaxID=3390595 RepID=UPI003D079780
MARRYAIYDVFTESKLAGNPLAVIFDADGLSDQAMQALAREMNLSETVFVQQADNPAHAARLRIFTPGKELPFAGHPTVGSAVALTELERGPDAGDVDLVCMIEEKIGPVRCAVRLRKGGVGFAEFDLPRKPARIDLSLDIEGLANALSVKTGDLGFENHMASIWSAGVPFLMLPLRNIAAVQNMEFDVTLWEKAAPFVEGSLASAYVYCRGGTHHQAKFHARMFSPDMGIAEDPATGAAVAALAGAIRHFDGLPDGHHPILVEQGVEMGRASYINLHIEVKDSDIGRVRIGGHAVKVAEGSLLV